MFTLMEYYKVAHAEAESLIEGGWVPSRLSDAIGNLFLKSAPSARSNGKRVGGFRIRQTGPGSLQYEWKTNAEEVAELKKRGLKSRIDEKKLLELMREHHVKPIERTSTPPPSDERPTGGEQQPASVTNETAATAAPKTNDDPGAAGNSVPATTEEVVPTPAPAPDKVPPARPDTEDDRAAIAWFETRVGELELTMREIADCKEGIAYHEARVAYYERVMAAINDRPDEDGLDAFADAVARASEKILVHKKKLGEIEEKLAPLRLQRTHYTRAIRAMRPSTTA